MTTAAWILDIYSSYVDLCHTNFVYDFDYKIDDDYLYSEIHGGFITPYLTSEIYGFMTSYGITAEMVKRLIIGFAQFDFRNLFIKTMAKKGVTLEMLKSSGLLFADGRSYFNGRYIFPFFYKGKIVDLIGGTQKNIKRKPIFSKYDDMKYKRLMKWEQNNPRKLHLDPSLTGSNYLYNQDDLDKYDTIVLSEGITDCISLMQNNIPTVSNVAANVQNKLLDLFIDKNVYIAYDIDAFSNQTGQTNSVHVANKLLGRAKSIYLMRICETGNVKVDVNEFFINTPNAKDAFFKQMENTPIYVPERNVLVPVTKKIDSVPNTEPEKQNISQHEVPEKEILDVVEKKRGEISVPEQLPSKCSLSLLNAFFYRHPKIETLPIALGMKHKVGYQCPFHNDTGKNKFDLVVLPNDQPEKSTYRFYCHVCKKCVTVLGLVEAVLNCSKDKALAYVCNFLQIDKPEIDYSKTKKKNKNPQKYVKNIETVVGENPKLGALFSNSTALPAYKYLVEFSSTRPLLKDFPYYDGKRVFFIGYRDLEKALSTVKSPKAIRLALDILILAGLLIQIPMKAKPARYQQGYGYQNKKFTRFKNHYVINTFSNADKLKRFLLKNIKKNKAVVRTVRKNGKVVFVRAEENAIRRLTNELFPVYSPTNHRQF